MLRTMSSLWVPNFDSAHDVPKLANKLFAQVNHSAQAINYSSLFYGKSNIKDKGMFLEVSV